MKTPSAGTIAVLGASALLAAGCGGSKSTSSKSAMGERMTLTVKHAGKLGAVLAAGPHKMTVYLFEADKGPSSKCSGACVAAWPPVTASGTPVPSGGAVAADLGTIKRPDGTTQVTYKGHPLYYFVKDKDSGDSYGEGVHAFGASWYALSPRGSKIDNS